MHLTVWSYHVCYSFQSEPPPYSFLKIKERLDLNTRFLKFRLLQWDSQWQPFSLETKTPDFSCIGQMVKAVLWLLFCTVHLTVCSYHVTHAFRSASTPFIFVNGREVLTRNRRHISTLCDSEGTPTYNSLVPKWTFNLLAKLAQCLSCVVNTYLYGAFDYILLSCHVRVPECIYTLCFHECQGSSCSRQVRYLKFKWLKRD